MPLHPEGSQHEGLESNIERKRLGLTYDGRVVHHNPICTSLLGNFFPHVNLLVVIPLEVKRVWTKPLVVCCIVHPRDLLRRRAYIMFVTWLEPMLLIISRDGPCGIDCLAQTPKLNVTGFDEHSSLEIGPDANGVVQSVIPFALHDLGLFVWNQFNLKGSVEILVRLIFPPKLPP